MRHQRTRPRIAAAMLALCLASAGPAASERPEPPPFYAIRDVQVVTGTGQTLERATVLIANGLIEAVGRDLEIPADAWVVEGDGLIVYPGLIDALTDLGQSRGDEAGPAGAGGPGRRSPGARGPTIRGPEDRPGTTPWRSAADLLTAEDSRVEDWRRAGFTAAVTSPSAGLFAGQAAAIHLGDAEPRQRVLATPVAQRIAFSNGGGFRAFPGSLMGGISYVKQVLSDARHETAVEALYQRSPKGRERPTYDRTLAPLRQAMADGLPMLLPAHHGREIDRVLSLASEYQIEPVLVGGQGAYERLTTLSKAGTGVLVSLDWPEAAKDRDPDLDTPLPTYYHRHKAPATPGLLHAAGVPFAFYSDGLSGPDKIFAGVRAAIDAGLTSEAALAALTSDAARLFGLDDRLGSIEVGKIANLIVATDEPWAEDVEIRAIFVDGRKYQQRDDDADKEPPASDISGTWEMELVTPGGTRDLTLELSMKPDGKTSGELTSQRGTRSVEQGRISGEVLSFKTEAPGRPGSKVSWTLTIEDETASGSMAAGPMRMDVSGRRTAQKSADEAGDDEPAVSLDELDQAMAVYRGPVRQVGSFAITNARVYTVSGATLASGTVVVENGKIEAVGSEIPIPAGVEIIDAGGGSLVPGIIDAHSHIAIEGGGNEGTVAVSSMVTIQDVIEPEDIAIYRALAGGVTTVNVLHGSANPIGGGNAVIKLRWGQNADGLRFAGAPSGIKFALGENPKRSRGNPPPGVARRYPATRMGVMDVIRQAFTEARTYRASWQRYERDQKAGKEPTPPRVDFKLERLAEILDGERLVHAHCYRADEILQLLRLAEEQGFKISTLQHVLEGYKVADEIAAHGAGASTFSDWWGYKVEAFDAIPHNAALMAERGVLVSINSDSAEEMRHLNQEAAKAMKWGGMDEVAALATVTLNPAKQLGIADRVGSIEVGKDADLTLYDGPPLSVFSVVQKTFVDGDLYFDIEADRQRQALIDDLKTKLDPPEDEDESDDEGSGAESASEATASEKPAPPPPPTHGSTAAAAPKASVAPNATLTPSEIR
ncbi:MAG: amidohydrolase family protein [Acidobacteriota bacterium]